MLHSIPGASPTSRWSPSCALALTCILALALAPSAGGDDWPQWRGPQRDGVWREEGILDRFPEAGLETTWSVPIGSGYAGPAVARGRVFVADWVRDPDQRGIRGSERLHCLDEETGERLWSRSWPADYSSLMASYAIGPRATPTVDGERVFVVGAMGHLSVFSTADGTLLWETDYPSDLGASIPTWGVASAPLVDGERLIVVAGAEPDGKVVAFDKSNGRELWRALSSDWEMGYGQPVILEAGGARQLVIWHPKALSSLDPTTGRVLWEEPWEVAYGMTVATPVRSGELLLVSQFYYGSLLVELDEQTPRARRRWAGSSRSEMPEETDGLHALVTTPVVDGETIYGVCSYGELRALDARTGERLWVNRELTRQGRWGAAFFVRNGDRYFMNNDLGELLIVRLAREGATEVDRTHLIEPTSRAGIGPRRSFDAAVNWSHPAYANRHVVARNDERIVRRSLAAASSGNAE
jgi:outer membrane protein assembly factor BamB